MDVRFVEAKLFDIPRFGSVNRLKFETVEQKQIFAWVTKLNYKPSESNELQMEDNE